ncbi:MAG: hypothetical protein CMO55_00525 [Verrucomicrobiales bacterium]|nr:hypothetical protein [Verrucomicrobiales bacterium]
MTRPATITIEGALAVEALLKSSAFRVQRVIVESGRHGMLVESAGELGIPVEEVSGEELAEIAGYDFHRGILAYADRPEPRLPDREFLQGAKRILAPIGLADPGNLGTIIRSAAAFGADAVLVEAGRGADVFARKCIRASATAIFHIPVFEVPSMPRFLFDAKEYGFVVFGTAANPSAKSLPDVHPGEKSIIFLGAEKDGLPDWFSEHCDEWIRIPMSSEIESLNVGAAASVVLYELFGRRKGD